MQTFKVFGSVSLFVLSVAAQESSATQGVLTMMWGDSKPTEAAVASSAESVGMAMSSQIATAAADMSMSGSMSGMPMATATASAMSGMDMESGMEMSEMSMATVSATDGAVREGACGLGVVMKMMGVGAALGV